MSEQLQNQLLNAVKSSNLINTIQLLRNGAKITDEIIEETKKIKDFTTNEIYKLIKEYKDGKNLDTILSSLLNTKAGKTYIPTTAITLKKYFDNVDISLKDIDITKVKDFSWLFTVTDRTDFNGIENWDTSNIENMNAMFFNFDFTKINNDSPLFKWISNLNTSKVKSMSSMFACSKGFNTDISRWDTSNVEDMNYMFATAKNFNQNISAWNISNVKTMIKMFYKAESFNQDISKWDTSNVHCLSYMFEDAKSFNQNIDNWNLENVNKNFNFKDNDSSYALENTPAYVTSQYSYIPYTKDVNTTVFNKEYDTFLNYKPFKNCPAQPSWLQPCSKENGKYKPKNKLQLIVLVRNKDISLNDIDISNITDLSSLFMANNRDYTGIEAWDTRHVKNMSFMFANTNNFNKDISNWNTSLVEDMSYMFYNVNKFNQNISKWNTSKVKNISYMFYNANDFNQNIGSWDTSKVTKMDSTFAYTYNFNQDIGSWNVSKVTNMEGMFEFAVSFNQDLSAWDVSKVTNMSYMFQDAVKYSYSLNSWNVSKLKKASGIFSEADNLKDKLTRPFADFYTRSSRRIRVESVYDLP